MTKQEVEDEKPAVVAWPATHNSSELREHYQFLNPYNFVRYLPKPNDLSDDPSTILLGRCAPPPHDRYVGLTGRITCQVEVNTPLFIADSHGVTVKRIQDDKGKQREHLSYRFFKIGGQDAIPATSLRGMVRSVFESVTNSCFGVFASEERLDYRQVDMAKQMQAAIVLRIPENETDLGEVALCEDARVPAYTNNNMVEPENWKCGEIGYAILTESGKTVKEWLTKTPIANENEQQIGWLKITGQTFPGKKHERFFYYSQGEDKATKIPFSWERMLDYNAILKAQVNDEKRNFHTQYQHHELSVGDLVYVRANRDDSDVLDISLVKVPRLKFRKSLADLLPEYLHPCSCYTALCPTCRTFGWVKNAHQRGTTIQDDNEEIAYAGRVNFSIGRLTKDQGVYAQKLPLAILSTPEPTTSLFYLLKGAPESPLENPPTGDQKVAYEAGYKLRGRKVYRHHGDQINRQNFERVEGKEDHQNRTVDGVRSPGNIFEFTVTFENLVLIR